MVAHTMQYVCMDDLLERHPLLLGERSKGLAPDGRPIQGGLAQDKRAEDTNGIQIDINGIQIDGGWL